MRTRLRTRSPSSARRLPSPAPRRVPASFRSPSRIPERGWAPSPRTVGSRPSPGAGRTARSRSGRSGPGTRSGLREAPSPPGSDPGARAPGNRSGGRGRERGRASRPWRRGDVRTWSDPLPLLAAQVDLVPAPVPVLAQGLDPVPRAEVPHADAGFHRPQDGPVLPVDGDVRHLLHLAGMLLQELGHLRAGEVLMDDGEVQVERGDRELFPRPLGAGGGPAELVDQGSPSDG